MKHLYAILFLCISLSITAQTPCENGMAGAYPCDGYDLQAYIPFTAMGATNANDSWGWTDPLDDKEYAIVGLNNGTAFIDISDPVNPVYLGRMPTVTGTATARDIKTFNNFAFVVSDNNGAHGMQIFDLTRLRNVASPPVTFTEDVLYSDFENAHNLAINEDTGYAYACRTNLFGGGVHFIDINDPLNPVNAGGVGGIFTHDAQIVTYNGPDSDYTGREILLSFNGFDQDVTIIDITDKSNTQVISNFDYTTSQHAHQGWLTEDHRYLIIGDESDELNLGFNTRTIIFDLLDLDNPVESFEYFGPTSATDHNGYVLGNKYYQASYNAGMRVIDITDIGNQSMTEIGYFDVYPANDSSGFSGAWSVYPYFNSGNIVISTLGSQGGFFLVKENTLGVDSFASDLGFSVYPNPVSDRLNIQNDAGIEITTLRLYDVMGRLIQEQKGNRSEITIPYTSSRFLFLQIDTEQGTVTKKLVIEK
ncbi:choice-of-anchor B family protein [Aureisphaera galaxeae]|uniref:choice-of-anchor B family protein n=1 Tax=Aureisphaera galaxeae TaxID=1538023 RepID=UPI0023502ECD|nr:choice-of-anchor B family protein [Aureisphaera galaxeae]MDC8004628.1 choice-of-anchor B family protein [Aureisphaera galaxeae]